MLPLYDTCNYKMLQIIYKNVIPLKIQFCVFKCLMFHKEKIVFNSWYIAIYISFVCAVVKQVRIIRWIMFAALKGINAISHNKLFTNQLRITNKARFISAQAVHDCVLNNLVHENYLLFVFTMLHNMNIKPIKPLSCISSYER